MASDPPINLNKARKARARADARAKADRNAAFHGLTKAEKDAARAETKRRDAQHDGTRKDPKP